MSSREDLLNRHKKEQRDLVATITGLKKQATKKTRRNVLVRCAELEKSLESRQQQELEALEHTGDSGDGAEAATGQKEKDKEITPEELLSKMQITTMPQGGEREVVQAPVESVAEAMSKPKRNRQKERLAKRNADIERIKSEARKEAESQVDYRKLEQESMDQLLQMHGLQVHEIQPDGHCLFASIRDQLMERHSVEVSVSDLRHEAGEYMKANADDFMPFLLNEETGQSEDLDLYIDKLTSTAMWGSDMEILALANCYDCPITVYIAGSSSVKFNEQGSAPELKLGYYKHSYGLGEHYNSLRDVNRPIEREAIQGAST